MSDGAARQRPRTCAGCGRVATRERLALRIAAGRDGRLRVGTGEPGRGAWLCGTECLDVAFHRGRLERALRRPVSSDDRVALRARLGR